MITIHAARPTSEMMGLPAAINEHSMFTPKSIRYVDSFEQRGFKLGKVLAERMIPELESTDEPKLKSDSSSNTLIRRYRRLQGLRI